METISRKFRSWEYENVRYWRKLRRSLLVFSERLIEFLAKHLSFGIYLTYSTMRLGYRFSVCALRGLFICLGRHEVKIRISPTESRGVSEYYHSLHDAETIASHLRR